MASLSMQVGKEFGSHTLPIHDHACHLTGSHTLFIACQECRDSYSEMLVAAVGGDEKGMAVLIMQQEERPATQDHTQAPNQPTWKKHITVDGLTMSVDV